MATAGLDTLADEIARFDPYLVVCSRSNTVDSNGRPAWFELPPDPERLAEICIDGRRSEVANPTLEELLWVVNETERLFLTKHDARNC